MSRDIRLKAEQLNKKQRRKRLWYRILSVPVCIVVFITTYAMILPAITLESSPDTLCGIEAHVHGNDCYETPGIPEHSVINCGVGDNPDSGEYIIHSHDSFCFDDRGELICALPEQAEHTHTDECYNGDSLTCGKIIGIDHRHTADCITVVTATEPQGLICTKTEHKHTAGCFALFSASVGTADINIALTDDVPESGCYKAALAAGGDLLEGKDIRFLWYKSIDGGKTYTAVEKRIYEINGNVVANIDDVNDSALNLALDSGTVTETRTSVKYRVTLMIDGTEYESISAEIENTTYQASVLNGSFESPDLTDHQYQEFVPEGTPGLYWKTTVGNEEGYTSGDKQHAFGGGLIQQGVHYIEIVDTSGSSSSTGSHKYQAANWHGQGNASAGKQYAEINAGAQGALYQTVTTIPGTTMYWSVDHSGRNGTDTMAVVMMPEKLAKNVITQEQLLIVINSPEKYNATVFKNLTASKDTWTTHSGQYTIPDGQHETRFFFVSISAAGDNAYIGNHIDNVWFSQKIPPASSTKPYLTLTKTVKGDLSEYELEKLSDKLTFELQRSTGKDGTYTTIKTYKASEIGEWSKNSDGSLSLWTRISMKDYTIGYYYRIIESGAELDGYTLSATASGSAVRLSSSTAADFTFTNSYTALGRTLTLKKLVNASDRSGNFEFTLSYTDTDGNIRTESITLCHGESTVINGIRKGTSVTVTETLSGGYTVTIKETASGRILSGGNSYTFTMSDNADITVYNTTSVGLPETGGIGTEVFIYVGTGIMLAAVIAGYFLRRRYGREDN